MLGHRGCRLGISYSEITEMQAQAILEAAILVQKSGIEVNPESCSIGWISKRIGDSG